MTGPLVDTSSRHPIKLWTRGVPIEAEALQQLRNLADLPFVHAHVAAMPDVHWGLGATIGSVLATRRAIVPAAVGVDIGCGMTAVRTTLRAADLPDSLRAVRTSIERAVPHGRTDRGGRDDRGAFARLPPAHAARWERLQPRYEAIVARHPKARAFNTSRQMGTLGTGNHFIEVCLDEHDAVWVMLHSGSRGPGNRIGTYFIEAAKRALEKDRDAPPLRDRDLAFLREGTPLFDEYVEAVGWAQDFAQQNRDAMLEAVLDALAPHVPPFERAERAVSCHHNYVAREHHFGADVWVTRKGAVRARAGDLGIIPGSMGTGSFIVRGKGNPDAFDSCSHGAGRAMSRNQARRTIGLEAHARAMRGIEARLDEGVLDESPAAYKDIGRVMAAQTDLVEVVARLRQVVNVKG